MGEDEGLIGKVAPAGKPAKKGRWLLEALDKIEVTMNLDHARARAKYEIACGRSPEDRSIDDQLEQALRKTVREGRNVLVPYELVLGLLLRSRGKGGGKGHPTNALLHERYNKMAVDWASERWAMLVDEYENRTGKKARQSKPFKVEAATWAHREAEGITLSVGTIMKRMSLKKGNAILRKSHR
jgi:hypothetical protein